jgi:hypothetical protein
MASTQPARYLGLEPRGQARVRWSDDWSRVLDVAFSPTTT